MTFITGCLLIDAPASALNNSGEDIPNAGRDQNTSAVKFIRAQDGKTYPYVSGQAVRYWLRNSLESSEDIPWHSSMIYRGEKIAYTDGNPIQYWDDDLFGYMRAPSKEEYKKTQEDEVEQGLTPLEIIGSGDKKRPVSLTRASPFRVGTLVSIGPVNITQDWGTMARQEGDAVPYEHQFYRCTLQTQFAIDLGMVGKFYYRRRTGFQNLDSIRRELALQNGLTHLEEEKAYLLPAEQRAQRVSSLLIGLSRMYGGAKQTSHYTPTAPVVAIFAIVRGGNNPFNYLFDFQRGSVVFNQSVFVEVVEDLKKHGQVLTDVLVGWHPGFLPDQRNSIPQDIAGSRVWVDTPQGAFAQMAQYLVEHPDVLDHAN